MGVGGGVVRGRKRRGRDRWRVGAVGERERERGGREGERERGRVVVMGGGWVGGGERGAGGSI